jgi:hypothetical protein
MTSYQQIEIKDFDQSEHPQTAPIRNEDNLPEAVKGQAVWREAAWKARHYVNRLPDSYHVAYEGHYHPIKFINKQWYWIDWDDSDNFKGYWVKKDSLLPQGSASLGWLHQDTETVTPRAIELSFSQTRERAKSGSTQPVEEVEQDSDEEEIMDENPQQTEALATVFEDTTTFANIAKEIDPAQSQTHYMPTIVPPTILRPTSINSVHGTPIMARSTHGTSTETLAATHEATRLITNAVKIDGQLKGRVSDEFYGDRTKTQTFMNAFDLFWMTNDENSSMKVPYKWCTYFLGLLKGPNVEDWVNDQTGTLREKLNRRSNPIAKTSETLWDDLKESFERSYTYSGQIEAAKRDLAKLKMVDSEIDNYIARFENLLRKAEIPRDEVRVIDKFTDGLTEGLHRSIMRKDKWPVTINGWQEAA